MSLLEIISSNFAGWDLCSYRQHWGESFVCIKEAIDEMKIPGPATTGADGKIAR